MWKTRPVAAVDRLRQWILGAALPGFTEPVIISDLSFYQWETHHLDPFG